MASINIIKGKDNTRSANVDLVRFIAALLIMAHHIYHIGVPIENYAFYDGWLYVEFFLIITGYYTAKHYDNKNYSNKIKDGIIYTIKKFLPFFPYTTIISALAWITNGYIYLVQGDWTIKMFIGSFLGGDFAFDVLLLSDSYTHPLVVPLWYLSAMIIVFPFFSWFMQLKNRYWVMAISFIYPLMYYGTIGITGNRTFPQDMLRVIAGMCLGSLIYECTYAFGESIKKINKVALTIVEMLTFTYPLISSFKNFATYRLNLLCFCICLMILIPGFSYSRELNGKFFTYLGKLSIPIFIIHWYIGTLINEISKLFSWNDSMRIILYYGVSIIISAIAMYFVDHWKWFNGIMKKPIKWND